jgi:hypothetical protein
MKTYKKPATSKLLTRFDNELKNMLMEDLKAFKVRTQFISSNNRSAKQQQAA